VGIPAAVQPFIDRMLGSASVRTVYGEPVVAGDKTIVPVACIAYGFGGGGGTRGGREGQPGDEGGGGGGGVSARPVGVVEITPAGTRFIEFGDRKKLAGALFAGLVLGVLIGRRRSRH
jgi:uncharacterized spore protein YtfJ